MFSAAAMATTGFWLAGRATGRFAGATTGGGKHGKFFGKFCRTAMRALGPFPMARADQDFAVLLALRTMEFVNRHMAKVFFY